MARSPRRLPAAAAALVGVALVACGGGGSGGTPVGELDSVAPSAALSAPAPLASGLAGTLTLQASASDNVGVAAVEFQVDAVQVASVPGPGPYSATIDSNAWASGQHVLRVRARDAAGNVSAWSSATVEFGGSRVVPAGFTRNLGWVGGLVDATAFAQAPDGRFFVAEQGGTLRVVRGGVLLAEPFVRLNVDSRGERGLIGVALHPDFAANGWVYLHYTTPEGGAHNRISRFTAVGDVASAGSEVRIADLPVLSTATNHNGGALHFGPDGKLYVGVGENANPANAQNLASPLGKILRFNADGTIPGDNPFAANASGLARAVWAYGLRNPFTFAFEPGGSRMYINDVGQNAWEEIDAGTAGANYGWPASEGPVNVSAGTTPPLFAYGHAPAAPPGSGPGGFLTGVAIAGGSFYPASGTFPAEYRGSYFFADLGSGFVARYDAANQAAYAFAQVGNSPVDLHASPFDGALYVLTRSAIARISRP
nr:PQQ-dependent sugar dehydrogenase [Schlegelella koreensis]